MSVKKTDPTFVLRPVRIEGARLVPTDGPELRLSLAQMFERFASRTDPGSEARLARQKVIGLRAGHYFGLYRDEAGVPRNFTVVIPSRDTQVRWLLNKMPALPEKLIELYEVLDAHRPSAFSNESSADTQ